MLTTIIVLLLVVFLAPQLLVGLFHAARFLAGVAILLGVGLFVLMAM